MIILYKLGTNKVPSLCNFHWHKTQKLGLELSFVSIVVTMFYTHIGRRANKYNILRLND